jgi:hypothetical protein
VRTDTAVFAAANRALSKEPRYVIEMAFDLGATVLRYFTSHTDAALPAGAVAISNVVQALSGTSQTLNPDTANASIGNFNFSLVDRSGSVTLALGGQLALGRSTRSQRVRLYVGYAGLAWSDYSLVQTQMVQDASYKDGAYSIRCLDVQRQLRNNIFDVASTTITASVLAADTTINVVSTTDFELLEHGSTYSDAPNATVLYFKLNDEVIRATGTTPTSFTGCARGVLNTLAADHPVDPTSTADQQPKVDEFVYLELPALKLMYAVLTGNILGTENLFPQSQTLDNAAWTKTASSVSANAGAAPDGTVTADKLVEDNTSTSHSIAQNLSKATAPVQYTYSVCAKAAGRNWIILQVQDGTTAWSSVYFDISAGIIGNALGAATITPVPGGFYRCSVTGVSTSVNLVVGITYMAQSNGGPSNYAGDGTSGVLLWAEQLNVGPLALPYAVTTSAARAGSMLPTSWNLGVDPSLVRLSDYLNKDDLYSAIDDDLGFNVFFQAMKKTDGKKFLETELALLLGVFMPVYADGSLGLKRMSNILTGAAYSAQFDETNVVSYGDLLHDFVSLHNVLEIDWNYELVQDDFTRQNFLIDEGSTEIYQTADVLTLAFRGLYGSRHTAAMLQGRFDAFRDRYSSPPLRLDISTYATQNGLEVGEIARVKLANIRDYIASSSGQIVSLDRSFEIQNVSIEWETGKLSFKLMATSRAPDAVAATADASVLTSGWYTGTGTSLASVITIAGSSPGHVTAGGTLQGSTSLLSTSAVYYYNGDLQIDASVLINWTQNIWLRVNGFLTVNGRMTGKGAGILGASKVAPLSRDPSSYTTNLGTQGFIGSTEAGGGAYIDGVIANSIRGDVVQGNNPTMPVFVLSWDGANLSGVPNDLRGSSGSTGVWANSGNPLLGDPRKIGGAGVRGGVGGAGGGGILITCKGISFGVAGQIDTSGADGFPGDSLDVGNYFMYGGSGAGGAPGGLLIILDGASTIATGLTTGFVARNGSTPIVAATLPSPSTEFDFQGALNLYSYYVGTGDGIAFPLPDMSGARGGSRVQYVPGNPAAVQDNPTVLGGDLESSVLSSWIAVLDQATAKILHAVAWVGFLQKFVAAGDIVTSNPLLYTFANDLVLTNQSNGMTSAIQGLAASGSIIVAVGGSAGVQNAYSSADAVTWTARGTTTAGLNGVCFGDKFVAVGNASSGSAYTLTSPDGVTWTVRTNSSTVRLRAVAWNGKRYVAVGDSNAGTPSIAFSDDGITWAQAASVPASAASLYSVAWHKATLRWIAVGDHVSTTPPLILSSFDGDNWSNVSNSFASGDDFRSLVSTGAVLVAGGVDGLGSVVTSMKLSDDGSNWRRAANPGGSNKYVFGLAWSGRRAIGVGGNSGGTSTYIVASGSL